jgi:hypothetical protein
MLISKPFLTRPPVPVVLCARNNTLVPLVQVKDSHILTLSNEKESVYLSGNYRTLIKYKNTPPEGMTAGKVQSIKKFIHLTFNQ